MTSLLNHLRRGVALLRAGLGLLTNNGRELVFVLGLALLAIGMRQVYAPAAYLVPGLILVWMTLPARGPIVFRTPAPPEKETR